MNLQRFIDAKQPELRALRRAMPAPLPCPRPSFLRALQAPLPPGQSLRAVAEFKRCSPSAGAIRADADPRSTALAYAAGGASCMSVLTERSFFHGSIADLNAAAVAGLPLLRKDFLFDELQVRESFATPASAILLIVALTPDSGRLRALRELAESQGLDAVTEIFSRRELELARESGARIIQVNARNLESFTTDRTACLRLASLREPSEVWIAASAMRERSHLRDAAAAGFDAALIGTALMQAPNPSLKLRQLLKLQ